MTGFLGPACPHLPAEFHNRSLSEHANLQVLRLGRRIDHGRTPYTALQRAQQAASATASNADR